MKWTAIAGTTAYVAKTGDTMTGALVLPGNASSALQATPLQQVQSSVAPYANNVGRNLLHNALFNVQQRGQGPFTTANAYTADRWQIILSNDTVSFSVTALADSDRTAIGDEAAGYKLSNNFTGNAAATAQTYIAQKSEDVRRLAGKTVTASFWAVAGSAGIKLGINLAQTFGSGGSPSAGVWATPVVVTTSQGWVRYTATFTLPSVVGKTFGTNGESSTWFTIFYSTGANANIVSGGIGVQSGLIWIWGVQLEIGSVATPLEKPDPQVDLANCQRFFQSTYFSYGGPTAVAASGVGNTGWVLPTTMRAAPSVVILSPGYAGNVTVMTVAYANANLIAPQFTYNGTGPWAASGTFQATADL